MAVISLSQAQLAFGHVALLDHADFALEQGERVGLIGRNGTGKSSLLKILARSAKLDDGLLVMQNGLKVVYVEQEPQFDPQLTIKQAVSGGLQDIFALHQEYETLSMQIGEDTSPELLERLHQIQDRLDSAQAWSIEHKIDSTLHQLNLPADALISAISGGMRKRVALACALVAAPDVLLLDEPTNHLDFSSIKWLEQLLKEFSGSVLFITHDRSFLDQVATRIVELDRGKLSSFPGNFTTYKNRKSELLEIEKIENAKFDKVLAQEEVWIRKGVEARRTRDEGRVRRLEQLRIQRAQRRELQGQVKMEISRADRSGKIVAELTDVNKTYGDRKIVHEFSSIILRGDKIGLIGANGAGKTTLLKLILGELQPDQGTVKQGSNLQVAYFDQMRAQLNDELSLADTISPGSEWVEVNGQRKHVMSYLSDFLFSPERARSPVKSLSGGERNRLLLARLFARPANVLVLDEPTNDLDIETLELLEELLEEYAGTVFLVSHDRAFLDNVVTQVIVSQGNGNWLEMVGGYSDWERYNQQQQKLAATLEVQSYNAANKLKNANTSASTSTASKNITTESAKPKKLSFKEQKELDELPKKIALLEAEQTQLSADLANPDLYKSGPEKAIQLQQRFAAIEEEMMLALERWEEIENKKK